MSSKYDSPYAQLQLASLRSFELYKQTNVVNHKTWALCQGAATCAGSLEREKNNDPL